ncbi:MAG: hypothetical protein UX85_C0003G0070 [Candidatus Beckwithbacteria bacterium GW2011_GWB1_47_15]|uniref:Methyltransferase type 11 domain-containing protein n=1 Tax=Candidatus Beckwithbacteria bacterium GW2011_GWB1_47_15 TaxID=1618371 RepID=A0A0G1RWA8_9BACT|nr:MAG: hypothetical protein UY43_C0001G0393 [Candidatus Beckwithbacteria bacterium GW2011_GWC1_49_16]KKU35316.1 MAG: hypothetical protein UX50_C0004G0047 [Candidatus Beckwithbacteria bacterium GW2011_GWA1_46_30]KKU61411.1 MAG: hypothetical protein UX85_C0003G0070 [Candidatus Beckwithbacteria bacterium GW2011_GWB1_47_15]KKU71818.1 MAG: hypothetical protein UX97_C0003G0047 [Candidatus Beckwithbacteria bacterium GW2011_GWA2_47_25]KKW03712.1 MAG: hypothetical protein UY37_C0004G0005 [Candidatus Be
MLPAESRREVLTRITYRKGLEDFFQQGPSEEVLNNHPPIGASLATVANIPLVSEKLRNRFTVPISVTMLGTGTPEEPDQVISFISNSLDVPCRDLRVVDFDNQIITSLRERKSPSITPLLTNATNTEIKDNSQDLVVLDYLLNYNPLAISPLILKEASTILRKGGIAIITLASSENIQTSDLRLIPYQELLDLINNKVSINDLRKVYRLAELKDRLTSEALQSIKNTILEILPEGLGYAFFGQDDSETGSWFTPFNQSLSLLQTYGLSMIFCFSYQSRQNTGLTCQKNILILEQARL